MGKPKTYGPYTCVHPVRRHLAGYSSLWLAKDHLLAVNCSGYTDKYNRYYLRDIQGFMLEDSERRFYIGLVFGILGAFAILFSLLGHAPWLLVASFSVLFGVPLIWNYVKGPGCKLFIITQVQSTKLEAVSRRAKAEKLIEELRPFIEAAQSDLARPGAAAKTVSEQANSESWDAQPAATQGLATEPAQPLREAEVQKPAELP